MTAPVLTTTRGTKATDAALVIALHDITALPVLDNGHLVGMITEADLLRTRSTGDQSDLLVGDVMSPASLLTTPDADTTELTQQMRLREVHTVPVVAHARLVGIITLRNLQQHDTAPS